MQSIIKSAIIWHITIGKKTKFVTNGIWTEVDHAHPQTKVVRNGNIIDIYTDSNAPQTTATVRLHDFSTEGLPENVKEALQSIYELSDECMEESKRRAVCSAMEGCATVEDNTNCDEKLSACYAEMDLCNDKAYQKAC